MIMWYTVINKAPPDLDHLPISEIITVSFTAEQLRSVEFFGDAVDLLDENGMISATDRKELTGFGHLSGQHGCKALLLHLPFLIIQYSFEPGIDGKPFSDIYLITTTHVKWRMRDSSKGIHTQLTQLYDARIADHHPYPFHNVYVPRGLSVYEYTYRANDNKETTAKTYSLDFGT